MKRATTMRTKFGPWALIFAIASLAQPVWAQKGSVSSEQGGAHTLYEQHSIDVMSWNQIASDDALVAEIPQVWVGNRVLSITDVCIGNRGGERILRPIDEAQYHFVPRLEGKAAINGSSAPYDVYTSLSEEASNVPSIAKGYYAYAAKPVRAAKPATSYLVRIYKTVSARERAKSGYRLLVGLKRFDVASCK